MHITHYWVSITLRCSQSMENPSDPPSSLCVFECLKFQIHEAFAGQILANFRALGSDKFGKVPLT
jgi:hypothetical protein